MVKHTVESFPQKGDSREEYEAALRKALAERVEIARERKEIEARGTELDTRDAELAALAQMLFGLLSPSQQGVYADKVAPVRPTPTARGTKIYDNVVKLITTEKKRDWTAPEMKEALSSRGVESELKPLHNIFDYLYREGKLKRVSRGRYVYMGVMFETADELPEMDDPVRFTD